MMRKGFRAVLLSLILLLFVDSFASVLYVGARTLVEDAVRSSTTNVAATAAALLRLSGRKALEDLVRDGVADEVFLVDGADRILYSSDPAVAVGRKREVLLTDRAEMEEARKNGRAAGYPFRGGERYLQRSYVSLDEEGTLLGVSAPVPVFSELDRLERIYWIWLVLSAALALGIAWLYFRALRMIERERERAEQGRRYETISRMAATVAHEIRNPLNIISATIELRRKRMKRAGDAENSRREEEEVLADLAEEVARLEGVVRDFLDLTREMQLVFSPVDVNSVVEEVVAGLRKRMKIGHLPRCSIELNLKREAGEMEGDERRLFQMLSNLIINGVQSAGKGGRVSVRTAGTKEKVILEIDDDGAGIPEEDRERIFEPFLTRRREGNGLGLAVVKRVVEGHGGEIQVQGSAWGGAHFTVIFPRRRGGRAVEPQSKSEVPRDVQAGTGIEWAAGL